MHDPCREVPQLLLACSFLTVNVFYDLTGRTLNTRTPCIEAQGLQISVQHQFSLFSRSLFIYCMLFLKETYLHWKCFFFSVSCRGMFWGVRPASVKNNCQHISCIRSGLCKLRANLGEWFISRQYSGLHLVLWRCIHICFPMCTNLPRTVSGSCRTKVLAVVVYISCENEKHSVGFCELQNNTYCMTFLWKK